MLEQAATACRIAELGAGLVLTNEKLNAQVLCESVERVVTARHFEITLRK
jgi:UDP:flavonoid glycosyltransferase YjiC (YdhE family)